jgi:hypothetical protein
MKQTTLSLAPRGLAAYTECETHLAERDALIAAHMGLPVAAVARQRGTCLALWELWERRTLSEIYAPLSVMGKLHQQVAADRRARQSARLAFGRECWAKGITMAEGDILRGQWPATRSEGLLSRWGRGMMDFCNRLTGVAVMVIAAIFAFGWIVHHGLMGVNP